MFSWTEELMNTTKRQINTMVAEVSGVPVQDESEQTATGPIDPSTIPLHSPFQLPITYLPADQIRPLSPIVSQDLELDATTSTTSKSMYDHLFLPSHPFGSAMIHEWKKQFTTNTQYLQDTQQVIQEIATKSNAGATTTSAPPRINHAGLMEIWKDTKQDGFFLEKYCFVEWDIIKSLNRSPGFLQVLSIANIMSPVLSLIIPLLFLIFPFILLKIRGIPITFSVYIEVLKDIAKHHFIGKALSNLSAISWDKLAYIFITLGLYLYQVYQNILLCKRFYQNIHRINEQLVEMREYLGQSIENMDQFVAAHWSKPTYTAFCETVTGHCDVLRQFRQELEPIRPVRHFVAKMGEVGYLLKCYYEMHSNVVYETSIRYSFGFEGFLDNLRGVNTHFVAGHINLATFDASASCTFDDQYYPPYYDQAHVKNRCDLSRNVIITGPNASGKTTLLKTSTINVIFSQQIGYGFYGSCTINPYTHIHSYLNIPDTSERDSLFQAESRRCKEIIDVIRNNVDNKTRHYCIFDELYSGTNPLEATKSAYAFLKYLTKFDNVDFILTTHYVSICSKLKKSPKIQNCKMDVVLLKNGGIEYTYRMKPGISKIQGAVRILEDMDYPAEIIDSVRNDRATGKKAKKSRVKKVAKKSD